MRELRQHLAERQRGLRIHEASQGREPLQEAAHLLHSAAEVDLSAKGEL